MSQTKHTHKKHRKRYSELDSYEKSMITLARANTSPDLSAVRKNRHIAQNMVLQTPNGRVKFYPTWNHAHQAISGMKVSLSEKDAESNLRAELLNNVTSENCSCQYQPDLGCVVVIY